MAMRLSAFAPVVLVEVSDSIQAAHVRAGRADFPLFGPIARIADACAGIHHKIAIERKDAVGFIEAIHHICVFAHAP